MAPRPSPNACGLAAYGQFARNLSVTGIDHPYWTSRKGNSYRIATWYKRRSNAGQYLLDIAPRHEGAVKEAMISAAAEFEAECQELSVVLALIPPGCDERVHWLEGNDTKMAERLLAAGERHRKGVEALEKALGAGAAAAKDADTAEKLVVDGNGILAEQALAELVRLAPKDLDVRLARLWAAVPDAKKEMADGPIHRQILYALDKVNTDVATEAIGKAIFFEGKGDDVNWAITRWAAEMYWARKGKDGRALWEKAIASPLPHVREYASPYVGRIGDEALLPLVKDLPFSGAYFSRILLGDETGWAPLIGELGGQKPTWAYLLLVELGAQAEPRLLPMLDDANPNISIGCAVVLSRVGTEASLAPLEKCAKAHAETPRLKRALDDLKKRLGK